jgi:uncharacterized RDD family membrane protein YckC
MPPSRRAASPTRGRISSLPYAGLQLRAVAFILDILVLISFGMLFAAAGAAYLVIDSNRHNGNISDSASYVVVAIMLAYVLAFVPLYHILMWSWWGQTVGQMAVHIKVMMRDGGGVPLGRSVLRLVGLGLAMLPLFLGVVMALFDRENRGLQDHLAGTVVVEVP